MDAAQVEQIHRVCEFILQWIGFGVVCGSIAKVLMPGRDPAGSLVTLSLGLAGSLFGAATYALISGSRLRDMISIQGFLIAIAGAWALLLVHRIFSGRYFGRYYQDDIVGQHLPGDVVIAEPRYTRRRRRPSQSTLSDLN